MGLGVSVYPERVDVDAIVQYLGRAGTLGYSRVFSCLLSAEGGRAHVVERFSPVARAAHEASMALTLDVSPVVFERLGISPDDLSFFCDLGANAIRLDEAFTPREVAALTHNPYGLAVELNASTADGTVAAVCACEPDRSRLSACHNFYPQRYTGLSASFMEQESRAAKELGLGVAAFVSSGQPDACGPWPLKEGLPTVEAHRNAPIDLQARHLFATGVVDDVLVSNCFASDDELRSLAALDPATVALGVVPAKGAEAPLFNALLGSSLRVRGDSSPYLLRDSDQRARLAPLGIAPHNTWGLVPGDVAVVNDRGGRYAGELQVVLKAMDNDGTKNVVANVVEEERFLLGYLGPWSGFSLLA